MEHIPEHIQIELDPNCDFNIESNPETFSEHLISHDKCENIKCPKSKCNFEAKNQQG